MSEPTNISVKLLATAQRFADSVPKPDGLKAIIVTGSVAKGVADEYSDIEMKFIWNQMPDEEQRKKLIEDIDHAVLFPEEHEDGEWVSSIVYAGTKVDISHADMPLLERYFEEVFEKLDTSIAKQTMFAAIESSKVLFGEPTHRELLDAISVFPDALCDACIKVNGSYSSWSMRNALLERNDYVALHHLVDATLLQILRMLFALNKTYLSSYNFKWIDHNSALLTIKPQDLSGRIRQIAQGPIDAAIKETDTLIRDVFELTRENRPALDLTQYERTLVYVRQPQDL